MSTWVRPRGSGPGVVAGESAAVVQRANERALSLYTVGLDTSEDLQDGLGFKTSSGSLVAAVARWRSLLCSPPPSSTCCPFAPFRFRHVGFLYIRRPCAPRLQANRLECRHPRRLCYDRRRRGRRRLQGLAQDRAGSLRSVDHPCSPFVSPRTHARPRLPAPTDVLVAVRIIQAALGFASPAIINGSGNPAVALSETSRSLTFLWDWGQVAILSALLTSLEHCVLEHQTWAKRFGNWWPYPVFAQLLIGYIVSAVGAQLANTDSLVSLMSFRLVRAGRTLLQIAMVFETLAILVLAFGFAQVIVRRRAGGRAPSVPAFSAGIAAIPILCAAVVRNLADHLRQWTLREAPLGELIATGLVPEAVSVVSWIALALRVWLWHRRQPKHVVGNGSEGVDGWQSGMQQQQQPVQYQAPVHQAAAYEYPFPAQQPGVYQPGGNQAGAYPPGMYPPNSYQPGVYHA